MGTVFRKQTTRPLPPGAEVADKGGRRVARWRVRGKLRTAAVTAGAGGAARIVTESSTYYAKYRDHTGAVVVRPTGCRDEQAARQRLAGWEREAEQIKAGTLDPAALAAVRKASAPLADHLAAYERSLVAAGVSNAYRANVLRAVRRVAADCGFAALTDFRRGPVGDWLASRVGDGTGARTRNYYRDSVVVFANWCRADGRLTGHDLGRLPKADVKADPRRQRRALTESELIRLLEVAVGRPLRDARTVRRGVRKGQVCAHISPAATARLAAVGRERALIYKTLVLTGLRADELRTLTVAQLDLTPGAGHLRLDAADEKNREGSVLAVRDDLAADLRSWLADRLAGLQSAARATGEQVPTRLPGDTRLFTVPTGLRRILDRDLKAAGIPKRDDRGRTIDVHAMRTTFGTLLSATGTSPRTAQAAMRHSDIKLTMGVYTDPRLLDVRAAVERLPALPLSPDVTATASLSIGDPANRRCADPEPGSVAPPVAPAPGRGGQREASGDSKEVPKGFATRVGAAVGSASFVNESAPVSSPDITGARVGLTGFEPATSWSRTKRSTKLSYSPSSTVHFGLPNRPPTAGMKIYQTGPAGTSSIPNFPQHRRPDPTGPATRTWGRHSLRADRQSFTDSRGRSRRPASLSRRGRRAG